MIKKNLLSETFAEIPVSKKSVEAPEQQKREEETIEKISKQELQNLRQELERTDLSKDLKIEAKKQAQNIKFLKEEERMENLLVMAKGKGVVYAVNVAKEMKDPYVLDKFHDRLAEKGYYKKFIK